MFDAWRRGRGRAFPTRASLELAWAAWRFRSRRADYYEYLADLLEGSAGRRSLRDMFDDDARRYGPASVRGVLASHWARAYQEAGGDLYAAWHGTVPHDDLLLIGTAQHAGAGALPATLRDLARAVRLVESARRAVSGTAAAGLAATAVAFGMLLAVPFHTVTRLKHVFAVVPQEYYGPIARRLFALGDLVQAAWPLALTATASLCWLAAWSLPRYTGRGRARLDRWAIWRLYRDMHAIRFLSMLSVLVRQRGNVGIRLRDALAMQAQGASPWQAWHFSRMIARTDAGLTGGDIFETGMIDRETGWFMADMIQTRGMDAGMQRTRLRLESHVLRRVAAQAAVLRWALLLASVGVLLGLLLWHYAAIDELRRSLTEYYAGR